MFEIKKQYASIWFYSNDLILLLLLIIIDELNDKRSLATSDDCWLKRVCDVNAICKAIGKNYHSCQCKNGFQGNGSVCFGREIVVCKWHGFALVNLMGSIISEIQLLLSQFHNDGQVHSLAYIKRGKAALAGYCI